MTQDPESERELALASELELALASELERRVDRVLKQLPPPSAPPAFAARVMRRIDALAPDAPSPAAFEWPLVWKVAFCGTGFLVVAAALLMWPLAIEYAHTAWNAPSVVLLRTAVDAVRPMVPAAVVYVTAMCAVAAATLSMLKHVALGGASQS